MRTLNDYILVVENVITTELCEKVLAEYTKSDEWAQAIVGLADENTNVRNCETICISYNHVIQKNQTVRQNIDQELFACASNAIKQYKSTFLHCTVEQDSGYDLLKYEVGDFYITHTDSFKGQQRAVSCSFALNDGYEGGEFAFFDREVVHKLKKGSCIMFPSNFMYPHEIMPVTSGTRYSIVTWFV
jgi:predicted 2-oxoglutarate/Fe(II)-dependent dioxygenase YbiX